MLDHRTDDADLDFFEEKVSESSQKLNDAVTEIAKEVWGQEDVIKNTLICMVAGGHLLAEGVPGLAKTRLVERVAHVMGLGSNRVQFTPDLMPSDILGTELLEKDDNGKKQFRFAQGPIFTQFFMADEINRASPRAQAALLQAMQEKKVSIAGETYYLPNSFHVMATQNPMDQEGTYSLPEAQLDRFMMKLNFGYPDEDAEKRVMTVTTGTSQNLRDVFDRIAAGEDLTNPDNYRDPDSKSKLRAILGKNDLIGMQLLAKSMPVSDDVIEASLQYVRAARPQDEKRAIEDTKEYVEFGPGPRAHQALISAAKARALMDGRLAPDVSDIDALVEPVLNHRIQLNARSRANGFTFDMLAKKLNPRQP